jgi:hypothetical protein
LTAWVCSLGIGQPALGRAIPRTVSVRAAQMRLSMDKTPARARMLQFRCGNADERAEYIRLCMTGAVSGEAPSAEKRSAWH